MSSPPHLSTAANIKDLSTSQFWLKKKLEDLSTEEWEALCDGCGYCCLLKLEDEDTGDVCTTSVVCPYMDVSNCQCTSYKKRLEIDSGCGQMTVELAKSCAWLPETCSYRLVANRQDLPDWHLLKGGSGAIQSKQSIVELSTIRYNEDTNLEQHIIMFH